MTIRFLHRDGSRLLRACVFCFALAAIRLGAQAPRPPVDGSPRLQPMRPPPAPPVTRARAVVETEELARPKEPPVPESQVAKPVPPRSVAPAAAPALGESTRPQTPSTQPTRASAAQVEAGPDVHPANATARCRDGSFVTSQVDANTCAGQGGLLVKFPQRRTPPPPRRP